MSSCEDRTEILVHITAPSRASDDERYRAQASAFLDFELSNVVNLPSQESSSKSGSARAAPSRPLESPEASFRSVCDNNASPRLILGRKRTFEESQASQPQEVSQSSWCAPPSVIADSNPDNDISIAALCSPTRILEHFLQNIESSSQSTQEVHTGEDSGLLIESFNGDHYSQAPPSEGPFSKEISSPFDRVLNTPCPPTRQPQSTAVPPQSSLTDERIDDSFQRDVEKIPCSQESEKSNGTELIVIPATPRAGSEPPTPKRHKRSPAKVIAQSLARSTSDVLPHGSRPMYDMEHTRKSPYLKKFEIHAPRPPVSCSDVDPGSLITHKLAKLAQELNLSQRFRPQTQYRQLRPFERGYWLVDCSHWHRDLKTRAWVFLGNYIERGDAAWGVSCLRDPGFTWMRFYCWGHVVGHIYLLLYLVSEQNLPYQWTSWYDASDKAQIVVGLKADNRP